jgi:zinc protease
MRHAPLRLLLVAPTLIGLVSIAAAARATPVPVARHVCADGLEVLVSESHATPLVTVEIAVHEGAMTEDRDYNGLSHLYEHMFFKANAAQPDQAAYMTRVRALGMEFNGSTDTERVNYYFTTTREHRVDQMVFMRDAIATPLFGASELARERVVVTGEIDRNESEPQYHLWHTMESKVFWKYPTRKDALGSRATVLGATVARMRTIQKRYYVPNNSVLVVSGDVNAEEVFAQADQLYASWARSEDPFKRFPVPVNPPVRASEVVLIAQPVEDVNASFEWQGPSTGGDGERDTYAADVLAALVGDPGSRFQKALVDSGACVSASLGYSTERHTGEISLDFEATPGKIDTCTAALVAELPALQAADAFGDEEMRNAVHRLVVRRAHERETTEGRAHALTWAWASSSLEYDATYEERIARVTRDDLSSFLRQWVLGKPFVLGAMASQAQLDAGLTRQRLERLVGLGPPSAKKEGAR